MAVRLIVALEVEQDLAEASAWYESGRAGLGEGFLSCVDACVAGERHMTETTNGRPAFRGRLYAVPTSNGSSNA